MPITINLDGVEPWKGAAVLSKGTHLVRCIDAEEGTSSGGHHEIHLTWEAVAGDEKGASIQDWVQITETTLGKVRQLLEATRLPIPSGEFSLEARPFLGTSAEIVVRERARPDGQLRNEIAAYNAPRSDVPSDTGFGARPMATAVAKAADDDVPF